MLEVKDVMTQDVVTVPAGLSLKEAARALVEHGISGVPVVDGEQVIGVLSATDVLPKEALDATFGGTRRAGSVRARLDAVVVGEAMTAPAVTVEPHRPLSAAARLMLEHDVTRLPVVQDGKLVGIVTRTDLLRAFVRSDAEVERDVREEIERLRLDAGRLAVGISDGVVTIAGGVDDRPDAEVLTLRVGRVPGVVSVSSSVSWRDDDPEL